MHAMKEYRVGGGIAPFLMEASGERHTLAVVPPGKGPWVVLRSVWTFREGEAFLASIGNQSRDWPVHSLATVLTELSHLHCMMYILAELFCKDEQIFRYTAWEFCGSTLPVG